MTKLEFLTGLRQRLAGLPQEDIEERLGFYEEMIDDRIEEGDSEEEAVAAVGSIDEIVAQILADYPLAKIVKEKVRARRRLRTWEIVLLAVGSPIWLSLLIACFAVALALYIVLWAIAFSLWAVDTALMVASLGGIILSIVIGAQGNAPAAVAGIGLSLIGIGCAILLFYGSIAVTKGFVLLTKKIFLGIKSLFVGKERNK